MWIEQMRTTAPMAMLLLSEMRDIHVFFKYKNYSVGQAHCAIHYVGHSVQQLCAVYPAVPRLISPSGVQQN